MYSAWQWGSFMKSYAILVGGRRQPDLATRQSGHSAEKLVVVGENGVKRRGPGTLVSRPSRLCGAFPNVQSTQNSALCALSAGSVSVQTSTENRGSDTPSARLGSLPSHQEQRAGPQPPRESGEGRSV